MIETLLCDADGNLFASEEPAFDASAVVTNRLLAELGDDRRFGGDELRRWAIGRNFRSVAQELAAERGVTIAPDALEAWVRAERDEVVAHLRTVLRPDPEVSAPLAALGDRMRLAVVSSSATPRLAVCLEATGLDGLFAADAIFSAEDSLPVPTSKPDPAVYVLAGERLGVAGERALAVEDALAGVQSAVAAGFPVVGNLQFVAADEREGRREALLAAGARDVIESWRELDGLIGG